MRIIMRQYRRTPRPWHDLRAPQNHVDQLYAIVLPLAGAINAVLPVPIEIDA
jgi:hypothetical protein